MNFQFFRDPMLKAGYASKTVKTFTVIWPKKRRLCIVVTVSESKCAPFRNNLPFP